MFFSFRWFSPDFLNPEHGRLVNPLASTDGLQKKKTGWLGAKNAPYGMPDLKNGTPMVGRKPFRRIVDGHQPNSRGLYTHYKDFPDHPKYRELTGNYFFQDFKV